MLVKSHVQHARNISYTRSEKPSCLRAQDRRMCGHAHIHIVASTVKAHDMAAIRMQGWENSTYAFKPIVIWDALQRHTCFLWMDSGLELRAPVTWAPQWLAVSLCQIDSVRLCICMYRITCRIHVRYACVCVCSLRI